MHAFEHRLTQLLDCLGELTAGRRQRLVRSLRQDDVELGVRSADASLDAAMKAALRVAAHEVLDAFCVHLEGALSRCRSDRGRALVMAITALVMAEGGCVLFAIDAGAAGVAFPAEETVVIAVAPRADVEMVVSRRTSSGVGSAIAVRIGAASGDSKGDSGVMMLEAAAIEEDPFREAKRVLMRVRAGSEGEL